MFLVSIMCFCFGCMGESGDVALILNEEILIFFPIGRLLSFDLRFFVGGAW